MGGSRIGNLSSADTFVEISFQQQSTFDLLTSSIGNESLGLAVVFTVDCSGPYHLLRSYELNLICNFHFALRARGG